VLCVRALPIVWRGIRKQKGCCLLLAKHLVTVFRGLIGTIIKLPPQWLLVAFLWMSEGSCSEC